MIKLITLAAAAAAALAACSSDHAITDPARSLSVGPSLSTSGPASVRNSGFYDHQIIEYEATAEVTSSPQAAQLISQGNVVFHIVGADGTTPAVQCARLLAALPNDATSCVAKRCDELQRAQLHPDRGRLQGGRVESTGLPLEPWRHPI